MKKQLRLQILQKRKGLARTFIVRKSQLITETLFSLDSFTEARSILFYVSANGEVATHDMIKKTLLRGKRVIVPVTDKKHHCLRLSRLRSWDDLALGAYSILEPKESCWDITEIADVELAIIPGVVFDKQGNRIGHGEGYYDSLLQEAIGVLKIGLAYDFQLVDEVPSEPYDVPVDVIITESQVIRCH